MSRLDNYINLALKAFVLVLFSLPFAVLGQTNNLEFEPFDTEDGLSQNLVFAIAQDQKGFMWFGTDEGLNRFDGHEFRIFHHSKTDSASISDNSVHALVVDDSGVVWIGTANGISRYYPERELLEQLSVNYDDPTKPKGNSVNEIRKSGDGRIWIAYLGSGVDVYDPKSNTFHHYTTHRDDQFRIINDYVITLQFMPDGDKLLGTRAGIQFLGADGVPLTDQVIAKKYSWRDKIDPSITSFQLSADSKTLWIGSELGGLYRVDLKTASVKNYTVQNSALRFNNNVPSVFEDSHGNVWIGGEAIYLYDKKSDELIPYDEAGVRGNVLSKNPVLSIFEDKDHNIWFGTFRLGLLKYNPDNTRIAHFHAGQGPQGLPNNQVLSFSQDRKENLWVGTDGGGLMTLKKDLTGFSKAAGFANFSSQVIKCMYEDNAGFLWLGTWDGGMMKYDPQNGTVKSFNPDLKNFPSRHVWDIEGDAKGNLWIGTLRDGLCYFEPATGAYKYYKSYPEDPTSLSNNDVLSVFLDSRSRLWVGTSNGLSILKPGSEKFTNLLLPELTVTVLSIYESEGGKMWLGTNGGGIVMMDSTLKVIGSLTEKDGLPSSTICSIIPDDNGNLWISTYNGLAKIRRSDLTITEIPQIAGVQGKEFIPRSGYRTRDGRLAFGGVNGFNLFHPDSLNFTPVAKPVVFTSLKINNTEIRPGQPYDNRVILDASISQANSINLSYQDRSFTISFASLTYNWQTNLHYRYFLDGLDDQWQQTTAKKRFIHYTNLDPGTYTLYAKSSFDGKSWPEQAQTLTIHIEPPWWGTIGFRIFAIALSAALLYLVYKTRVRFLQKQQDKLEEIVLQRTQQLKKSHDEIQILLEEVADKKEQIEQQMMELKQVNEEIGAQRDVLELRSQELERAQDRLKDVNASLEALVEKRTQKLSDALRELETFLYRASHDLRGPISSMLGLISASKLEKDPVRYNAMYSEYLQRTVMSLDRTLQKLLQKHTIEKKKIYAEKISKPELLILLHEILNNLPCYRPSDLELHVDDDLLIETDRMMLTIILSNLLENAFFYSDRSGDKRVAVHFNDMGHALKITVEDHGPGIKVDIKDKIFTMFYRGHETSTGNGLGLYLVKSVLSKINGTIEVETQEGHFSRFIVKLPLHAHQLHLN